VGDVAGGAGIHRPQQQAWGAAFRQAGAPESKAAAAAAETTAFYTPPLSGSQG